MELKAKLNLETIQDSKNLCDKLGEEDLRNIGFDVVQSYEVDKQSRRKWETKMEDATKLALQLVEPKTYPWPQASNVKFPLLTIASLQFQSRAYPSLIKAPDLVKYRVQGKDDGQKAARAQRISSHMSYQLLEQDESWEEDQDKAFLALPILGCVFKKSYYDPVVGHNRSRIVLPKNLVVHYFAKSIDDCQRKTEIFELSNNEIRERELRGIFKEHEYGPPPTGDLNKEEDNRQGLTPPFNDNASDVPRVFLEQHCYLDLDKDGYREPYVITVDKSTSKVARIVSRIDSIVTEQSIQIKDLQTRVRMIAEGAMQAPEDQAAQAEQTIIRIQQQIEELAAQKQKILRINPVEYYTKYSFIPSPDGGFYDLGFGALLSPINDSVNTLLNQLIDAGSLQNSNSGFLGKGARIKGGKIRFGPNEWKRVNVTGQNLRDSIVPLPVNQPSDVLFNLLSLLINYAERVGSVTDTMTGENPGQNTPAYNMSAMLEQGLQVFNGIFKRVYRSQRAEFRKLFKLNAIYLDQEEYFTYQDSENKALRTDYTADAKDLIPAADPNAFSSKEKIMKAQAVREASMQVPGYDPIKVEQRFLEAMDIPDATEVFPLVPETDETGTETGSMTYKFPPQPDPELEIEKADMQRRVLEGQARAEKDLMLAQSKVNVDEAAIIKLMSEAQETADKPELERLKLLLKEQEDIRKNLVEMAKIDEQSKQQANSGVDGKSSNSGS
jgi:chaperonin GroES